MASNSQTLNYVKIARVGMKKRFRRRMLISILYFS